MDLQSDRALVFVFDRITTNCHQVPPIAVQTSISSLHHDKLEFKGGLLVVRPLLLFKPITLPPSHCNESLVRHIIASPGLSHQRLSAGLPQPSPGPPKRARPPPAAAAALSDLSIHPVSQAVSHRPKVVEIFRTRAPRLILIQNLLSSVHVVKCCRESKPVRFADIGSPA
jgi:hypothetical protein